jgi:DNA-directed RNA polymerase alpha subunit
MVYFKDNTGVVEEEVLAQRLGMLPLLVDPDLFRMPREKDVTPPPRQADIHYPTVCCLFVHMMCAAILPHKCLFE